MVSREDKLRQQQRLGEGVIYVEAPDVFRAAVITEVHSDTVMSLLVTNPDGTTAVKRNVPLDGSGSKPGHWAWRVRS